MIRGKIIKSESLSLILATNIELLKVFKFSITININITVDNITPVYVGKAIILKLKKSLISAGWSYASTFQHDLWRYECGRKGRILRSNHCSCSVYKWSIHIPRNIPDICCCVRCLKRQFEGLSKWRGSVPECPNAQSANLKFFQYRPLGLTKSTVYLKNNYSCGSISLI